MSQVPCNNIEATIQKITQDLQAIDDQLHALEVDGLNPQHPWDYVVLQQQVDGLSIKKRSLQDAWNRAMTDLAICRSQTSVQDPESSPSHGIGSSRLPMQDEEGESLSTPAAVLVQAAIDAWEAKDASALASYLSDDLTCRHVLSQTVSKAQLIASMAAMTTAFPDWSFNGHVLNVENLAEQYWKVLYVTAITGTNTGYLSLPTLPVIPPSGRKIILEARHLEFLVVNGRIKEIDADFSPDGLEEVLAQLRLELP